MLWIILIQVFAFGQEIFTLGKSLWSHFHFLLGLSLNEISWKSITSYFRISWSKVIHFRVRWWNLLQLYCPQSVSINATKPDSSIDRKNVFFVDNFHFWCSIYLRNTAKLSCFNWSVQTRENFIRIDWHEHFPAGWAWAGWFGKLLYLFYEELDIPCIKRQIELEHKLRAAHATRHMTKLMFKTNNMRC